MTCQDHHTFTIKTPVIMDIAFIDISDQMDLLLNYLERGEDVDKKPEEEGLICTKLEDPEYVGVYDDQSNQPLDLSLKKQSPRPESSPKVSHIQSYTPPYSSNMSSDSSDESNMSFPYSPSLMPQSSFYESSFLQCLPSVRSPTSIIETPNINFSITPLTTCSNCSTTTTSTWRKDSLGLPVCNACGVYYRVHQKKRPAEWGREGISRRTRRKRSKVENKMNVGNK